MHRLLLLLFTLLWSTLAQADSTLRLVSDRPVIIVVNLVPYTIGVDAPRHVVFEGRKVGTQRVTVRNLAGQELYSGTVVVSDNELVVLAWRDKQLQVIDRRLQNPNRNQDDPPKEKPKAGHTQLDQLAADLPSSDLLDLLSEAPDASNAPSTASTASSSTPSDAPTGPRAATGPALRVVPQSQSWFNVWIAENRVWEYRGEVAHYDLDLPPGTYAVEFRDFTDNTVWLRGQVTLTLGVPAELHVAKSAPTQVVGATWTPEE